MSVRSQIGRAGRRLVGNRLYDRLRASTRPEFDFLRRSRGVIHVGANSGQERDLYYAFNLPVVWIEPIREIFDELKQNIASYSDQRALNYLIVDEDEKDVPLHIANNHGASSSILELGSHREVWPEVTFTETVTMRGFKLGTVLRNEGIEIADYDALVLDTQGSENRVLKGATEVLPHFRIIKVEVPDFESYKGCCQIADLSDFMMKNGFREHRRIPFQQMPGLGTYYDVVYSRADR